MRTFKLERKRDTMDRNVNIIVGLNGEKIVLINDIRFKGKKREDWKEVENYLKEYVGEFYEIAETSEKIFISSSFPDEYAGSESRIALKGAVAKAKANAAQGIPELIQIATNGEYSENTKKKHEKDAKYGWYRYDVRFALPVYDDKSGEVCRYNVFFARMLVRNDADGTVNEGEIKATDAQRNPSVVKTTVSYINKVLGTELSRAEMEKIFDQLGFTVAGSEDELVVTIPNRRWDISIPADLVEEVGRIYGYDNLKSTQPLLAETHGGYSAKETAMRRIKDIVQGQGLMEAISYSLTSPEKAISFTKAVVEVQWPLNSSRSTMRENLITGLVDAASYNMARKQKELALFEQGRVYDHENNTFNEHEHLAALYSGHTLAANWQHLDQKIDFYFVKGQLTNLFRAIGIKDEDVEYRAELVQGMHPTRTAGIYINDQYVGLIGMLAHAVTTLDKALRGSEIYVYEIDLDAIVSMLHKGMKAKAAPKFPAIERDLSLLVPNDVTNAQIEAQIKLNGGKYLYDIRVIDVYAGSQIESGHKSISYSLTFLNEKDTLTDEVVATAMKKIEADLKESLKIKVR